MAVEALTTTSLFLFLFISSLVHLAYLHHAFELSINLENKIMNEQKSRVVYSSSGVTLEREEHKDGEGGGGGGQR